jgi:hypothetical protein
MACFSKSLQLCLCVSQGERVFAHHDLVFELYVVQNLWLISILLLQLHFTDKLFGRFTIRLRNAEIRSERFLLREALLFVPFESLLFSHETVKLHFNIVQSLEGS